MIFFTFFQTLGGGSIFDPKISPQCIFVGYFSGQGINACLEEVKKFGDQLNVVQLNWDQLTDFVNIYWQLCSKSEKLDMSSKRPKGGVKLQRNWCNL